MVAVKPQAVADVVLSNKGVCSPGSVVVSIMAGIGLDRLRALFPAAASTVRTMPNLAAMSGASATALIADPECSPAHRHIAEALMACVGSTHWLPAEDTMDAACGLSGSGPAYVFYLVECLAAAGISEGLPPEVSRELARATVMGAGSVLVDVETPPEDLRQQVTSPGGTTQAGLAVLMQDGALERLVAGAVRAATRRSRELDA